MLSTKDIENAVFSDAMRGYKKDDVDALLDQVSADYRQFETTIASLQAKVETLEKELLDKDVDVNSINTVLISAQKLADQIVADAKVTAEDTVEKANAEAENIKIRTKKALEEIDSVLTEQKNKAQAEVDHMLSDAARKSEGMIMAAKDSVTRQQLLFDKLKTEVAEFKLTIKETYKTHLESLSKLPDEVVLNPDLAANAVEEIINNEPDLLKFIEKNPFEAPSVVVDTELEESVIEIEEPIYEVAELDAQESEVTINEEVSQDTIEMPSFGFMVQMDDDEEEDNLSNNFFGSK